MLDESDLRFFGVALVGFLGVFLPEEWIVSFRCRESIASLARPFVSVWLYALTELIQIRDYFTLVYQTKKA